MIGMRLETWQASLLLLGVVVLVYVGMWLGWRRRGRKHELPPLEPAPPVAGLPEPTLTGGARYFGTTVAGDWLDRVVARGLGARSSCRLNLSGEGLDVVRLAGSFRIAASALRGARHDQGIAGKVVPPHGLLVVTWQHGGYTLDTGFRMTDPDSHRTWVRALSTMSKENR
jgi:hypothetical protein